VKETEYKM